MVIVPKALFVQNHIVNTFDLPEIEALKATLQRHLLEIEGKDTVTRQTQGLACGLPKDAVYSAHDGCPTMCRGAHSESAQVCDGLFENFDGVVRAISSRERSVPFLIVPKMMFNSAQIVMAMALRNVGLECCSVELTAALEIALNSPDIEEVWLRDQSVLPPARLTSVNERYVTGVNGIAPARSE